MRNCDVSFEFSVEGVFAAKSRIWVAKPETNRVDDRILSGRLLTDLKQQQPCRLPNQTAESSLSESRKYFAGNDLERKQLVTQNRDKPRHRERKRDQFDDNP